MTRSWAARYRIPFSFLVGIGILLLAKPSHASIGWGFPWVAAGVALRTWSSGHIQKNKELATDGPYAFTRNPLYFGSFLIGFGFGVMVNRPLLLFLFFLVFWAVYRAVIEEEETLLKQRFGEDYLSYARRVPRFFPKWPGASDTASRAGEFDWGLVVKHREYYAWFGAVLSLGWLWWRL
jgi:protein-S-isoprenylcysteine O-methyltransferase Ste14